MFAERVEEESGDDVESPSHTPFARRDRSADGTDHSDAGVIPGGNLDTATDLQHRGRPRSDRIDPHFWRNSRVEYRLRQRDRRRRHQE